jgi:hypothetical protein
MSAGRANIRALLGLVTALLFSIAVPGQADEPAVPIELQAELLSRVLKYDRNFAARAGQRVQVLVAYRAGAAESERVSQLMTESLKGIKSLGGLPHDDQLFAYVSPAQLFRAANASHAALVILSPGIEQDAPAIARAFEGFDGLTVTTSPRGVEGGIVLGFDLVSGKPRMLLHLTQARRQNADFRSEILKVMKVIQ